MEKVLLAGWNSRAEAASRPGLPCPARASHLNCTEPVSSSVKWLRVGCSGEVLIGSFKQCFRTERERGDRKAKVNLNGFPFHFPTVESTACCPLHKGNVCEVGLGIDLGVCFLDKK